MLKAVILIPPLACFTFGSLSLVAAGQDSQRPTAAQAADSARVSRQTGKGPGMGRDYQKSTPGPGQGEPNHRGGRDGEGGAPAPTGSPGQGQQGMESAPGQQHTPSGKRSGGAGVGYPGYRGQGSGDYPQHRQYGNPPKGLEAAEPSKQKLPLKQPEAQNDRH